MKNSSKLVKPKSFFWWVYPILFNQNGIINLSSFSIPKSLSTEEIGSQLWISWMVQLLKPNPSLFKGILDTFGYEYLQLVLITGICNCVLKTIRSLLVGYLIDFVIGKHSLTSGILQCSFLILISFTLVTLTQIGIYSCDKLGMKIRVGSTYCIYKKSLILNQVSEYYRNSEHVLTNLISNDLNRFDRYMIHLPYLIVGPVHLIITLLVLSYYVGECALVGVFFFLFLILVQGWIGKYFGQLRRLVAEKTDRRISIMKELIHGIQIIKLMSWESIFHKLISDSRKAELQSLYKQGMAEVFLRSSFEVSSRFVILLTLIPYVLNGNIVTPKNVFVILSLYDNMRLPVCSFFYRAIIGLAELKVCIDRIQKFLLEPEIKKRGGTRISSLSLQRERSCSGFILVDHFSTTWKKKIKRLSSTSNKILQVADITFQVKSNEFYGISGPVGSGKTTLLYGILGELEPIQGTISVSGSLSYTSQNPTIFPGSIRENILFGRKWDENWYNVVIWACALSHDLSQFPLKDQTLIGDKGDTLSGGQKARVNLARAIYGNTDIYIFDDPLSSLDVKVGWHIYENCFKNLLKNKCILLVSHNWKYFESSDKIIILDAGKMEAQGTALELKIQGYQSKSSESSSSSLLVGPHINDVGESTKFPPLPQPTTTTGTRIQTYYGPYYENENHNFSNMESHIYGPKLYYKYASYGNHCWIILGSLILIILPQIIGNSADYYLKNWSNQFTNVTSTGTIGQMEHGVEATIFLKQCDYLFLYASFMIGLLLTTILKYSLSYIIGIRSSKSIHRKMIDAILYAPFRFYQENGIGQILNRFVNDVGVMDDTIPKRFQITYRLLFVIIGSMVLVLFTTPLLAIPSIILFLFALGFRNIYTSKSLMVKHHEANARSPIFSHISHTLVGLITIRAYNAESYFLQTFCKLQNTHTAYYYLSISATRWYQMTIDWISWIYFTMVSVAVVVVPIDGGLAGLALTSACIVLEEFGYLFGQFNELDKSFVSIERIFDYCNIGPEEDNNKFCRISKYWPGHGKIVLNNVSIKYGKSHKDPMILRNIQLSVNPGEKVGIVGRTGAGKSTLVSSITRLVDLYSGTIHIDNMNIRRVPLKRLRSSLSIVPQIVLIFHGTVRDNIDPLHEYLDAQIIRALEKVNLMDKFRGYGGLKFMVEVGGGNLSYGECQLLQIARCLLRKTKILILDEVSQNIDPETENLIQKIIDEEFVRSTILIISHRLETIMTCDKICYLVNGQIEEFDKPYTLLNNPEGKFRSWIEQWEQSENNHLFKLCTSPNMNIEMEFPIPAERIL